MKTAVRLWAEAYNSASRRNWKWPLLSAIITATFLALAAWLLYWK